MAEMITTGLWMVEETKQEAFLAAWKEFASWASTRPGASTLTIGRATTDPNKFISFSVWASPDAVLAWKATPEFQEGLAQVVQHVDDFHPTELDVMAVATAGLSNASV